MYICKKHLGIDRIFISENFRNWKMTPCYILLIAFMAKKKYWKVKSLNWDIKEVSKQCQFGNILKTYQRKSKNYILIPKVWFFFLFRGKQHLQSPLENDKYLNVFCLSYFLLICKNLFMFFYYCKLEIVLSGSEWNTESATFKIMSHFY